MKKILAIVAMLMVFSITANAQEKKEKWFGAGVKPDPHITVPFLGVKAPLPTVCAGKDVSTSFDVKVSKEGVMLKFPYFKFDWNFPAVSLGRGKAKVTLGSE